MSRTIRLDEAPDGYRGDPSCIDFIIDVEKKHLGGNGTPSVARIYFGGGQRAGTLRTWYGSNGSGKKAKQTFEPADDVEVEYVDWQQVT